MISKLKNGVSVSLLATAAVLTFPYVFGDAHNSPEMAALILGLIGASLLVAIIPVPTR